ncbi:MAG: formylglycine-generating enzyme family protein [Planctomycetota bacterium]|nr:formylglycine-generating enzyme family protein [Planctomycetota bacterium]
MEWEYACCAGTVTRFSCGSDDDLLKNYACFGVSVTTSGSGSTCRCGELRPSLRGLFDMHGNVSEWCSDGYDDGASSRVIRGGGWGSSAWFCRAAIRGRFVPLLRSGSLGFRVAAVPPGGASQEPANR